MMKILIACGAMALALAGAALALASPWRPHSQPGPSADTIVSAVAAAQASASQVTASQPGTAQPACSPDRQPAIR